MPLRSHLIFLIPTMSINNPYRQNLDFLLYDWLNVATLTARPRYAEHSRETFDQALDLAATIARDFLAPCYKKGDQVEPWFDGERVQLIPELETAVRAVVDAGLIAAGQDEAFGGMQLPKVVDSALWTFGLMANIAACAYPYLTKANAALLLAHGSADQIEKFARPLLAGRFFGTMCLSEPEAGSSLADIRTRAVVQPDGSYRLFGNKMWISAGDHELTENIIHLVLAKIVNDDGTLPAGAGGISLFIVPKKILDENGNSGERNDIALAGLNHKMGYRATSNCLLNFGEAKFKPQGSAGAVGDLVGAPGKGLAQMFHMMNEARIGIGLGATMLGYAGYLASLDYARTRTQGRAAADKNPHAPPIAIIEHTDVKRMLLAQKSYVEGALALNLYCAMLVDDEHTHAEPARRAEAKLLLDILTPIAKSWPSQWCLAANDLAIQIHGGYGYTRDYNVEQLYRDNRLNAIHEGTHGIQGLDLLARKVVMQKGAALALVDREINTTINRAKSNNHAAFQAYADSLASHWQHLLKATLHTHASPDINIALANSTSYLEAFGHIVIAWLWLDQALALATRNDDFAIGKMHACQYFFVSELPKVGAMLALLDSRDTTALTMRDAWF